MDFSSFSTKYPIWKYQVKIMWEKQSCNEACIIKKGSILFAIYAPYDPEVLLRVIWHRPKVARRLCVSLLQWAGYRGYIFEKDYSFDRCPNPVYFNIPLLIVYCSAIKHLFVIQKLRFIVSTFFGFAQNTLRAFQNTVLNSKWHCLRQMPQ